MAEFELDDDAKAKVREWVNARWKGHCQCCGYNLWEGGRHLISLRIEDPRQLGNLYIGGPMVPVVPITCKNCGNTVLVNALMMGVVAKPEAKDGQ